MKLISILSEDLGKWFGSGKTGGWDRYNTKGEKVGKCGDAEEGEPYVACLSNEKAAKLGPKGRASFVRRKREAQKKSGDAKKGGEQSKGQKPVLVKTGASENVKEDWSQKYKNSIDCSNPKGFSQRAHCDGRQKNESMKLTLEQKLNLFLEKNVPNDPEKWSYAKSQAKEKFDVYPSAYANGWAAKKYKEMGGGWKSVSEAVKDSLDIGEYDQEGDMAKSDLRSIIANAKKMHDMIEDADNLPEWVQSKITKAEDYISTVANYLTAEMSEETELQESGGEVLYKKGNDHIEKYGEDSFALYKNGKKEKFYTSLKDAKQAMNEDWQDVNRKDNTDGMSQKAVNTYKRENPGSNLQTAVTEKNPTGKRASRRKSFCARMSGMKSAHASAETKRDPDSPINKALRRWRC
jgi:hypothetical protein